MRLLADASDQGPLIALADRLTDQVRTVGGLELDRRRYSVSVDGDPVALTLHEFTLLWVLASNPGWVYSRGDLDGLARAITGDDPRSMDPAIDRAIDVHMSKIRRAIGTHRITTVRGVGYLLEAEG